MRTPLLTLALPLFLSLSGLANAYVFSCAEGQNHIRYQDTPCEPTMGQQDVDAHTPAAVPVARAEVPKPVTREIPVTVWSAPTVAPVVSSTTMQMASSEAETFCRNLSGLAATMIEARDRGVPLSTVQATARQQEQHWTSPPEVHPILRAIFATMLHTIYTNPQVTSTQAQDLMLTTCRSQFVRY